MKTKQDWNKSGKSLSEYLQVGDMVDEDMYYYFLEVLPPACNSNNYVQIGEPAFHTNKGQPAFATLLKVGSNWVDVGEIVTPIGEKCLYVQ